MHLLWRTYNDVEHIYYHFTGSNVENIMNLMLKNSKGRKVIKSSVIRPIFAKENNEQALNLRTNLAAKQYV